MSRAITIKQLNKRPQEITAPQLVKSWKTIKYMRNHIIERIDKDPISFPWMVTMLRYALFSLCLKILDKNQKIWALCSACLYAEGIRNSVRRSFSN